MAAVERGSGTKSASDLMALDNVPPHEARSTLLHLDKQHGQRRRWYGQNWAKPRWLRLWNTWLCWPKPPGMAWPVLQRSLQPHTAIRAGGRTTLSSGRFASEKPADVEVISIAIRSVYLPWAEASARYLQKVVEGSSYPGGTIDASTPVPRQAGECVFFVDGLRFDAARRLANMLVSNGFRGHGTASLGRPAQRNRDG